MQTVALTTRGWTSTPLSRSHDLASRRADDGRGASSMDRAF
jgi:hypothetical protein